MQCVGPNTLSKRVSNSNREECPPAVSGAFEALTSPSLCPAIYMKHHLLFICSGNLNRSPTAESLFSDSKYYESKPAGTDEHAVVRVSQDLIDWADIVFVMSEKDDGHLAFIANNFSLKNKPVCDLDVSDDYDRDDPELISLLRRKIKRVILQKGYPADARSLG